MSEQPRQQTAIRPRYVVEGKRRCQYCHRETCSCNDWAIYDYSERGGKEHSTYFHHHVAVEVAAALNLAATQECNSV